MPPIKMPTPESVVWPALFASMPALTGKVIAITGCTTGTGFIAAKACANKGATVLMLNRASERATAALAKVQAEGKAEHVDCDLQDFASVRAAGAALRSKYPDGIDVLANNAGVMGFDDYSTKDGFDVQMQVNHLSHFLLTKEVMPLLEKKASATGEARIVNHSSGARHGPPLEAKYFEAGLGGKLGGNGPGFTGPNFMRYHMTKLANCVFTYELKRKLEARASKIKVMVAEPGMAATDLAGNMVSSSTEAVDDVENMQKMLDRAQSAEDGTAGLFRGMVDPTAQSGDFFGPKEMTGPAERKAEEPPLMDKEQGELLWTMSVKAVGGDIFE